MSSDWKGSGLWSVETTLPRYDTLKKYVYQLEKQQVGYRDAVHDLEANESTSLMQGTSENVSTDALFTPLLDRELKKITLFYEAQEKELLEEVHGLERMVQQQEADGPDSGHQYDRHVDEDEDEDDDEDFNHALQSSEITFSRSPAGRRRRSLSVGTDMHGQPGRLRCMYVYSKLTIIVGVSSRREWSSNRRYSMSSNEDPGDLEASIASLRSAATQNELVGSQTWSGGQGRGASRSPMHAARTIASKIFSMDSNVPDTVWTAKNNYAMDIQLLFKRRITNLYLSLTSLRSYVELNLTGFRKILKKCVSFMFPGWPMIFSIYTC